MVCIPICHCCFMHANMTVDVLMWWWSADIIWQMMLFCCWFHQIKNIIRSRIRWTNVTMLQMCLLCTHNKMFIMCIHKAISYDAICIQNDATEYKSLWKSFSTLCAKALVPGFWNVQKKWVLLYVVGIHTKLCIQKTLLHNFYSYPVQFLQQYQTQEIQ